MNGYYLYCIREKQHSVFRANGLYESSQAFALPFDNLEAIVSEVPLEQLGQEQIQQKAREDLNWIKEMAQRHESVIEQAMRIDGKIQPVIPMRFGTIFRTSESVAQALENAGSDYSECLAQLRQKQEWSVKLYLCDPGLLEAEVIENDPAILRKKKEIEAMPKGMAYFFQSELENLISKSVGMKVENNAESVFNALEQLACSGLHGKILEKEFTGRSEPMILNAIFLIQDEKISFFKKEVMRQDATLRAKGLLIEFSGPWPPYHFAKV